MVGWTRAEINRMDDRATLQSIAIEEGGYSENYVKNKSVKYLKMMLNHKLDQQESN
jgi:hypothetical protein